MDPLIPLIAETLADDERNVMVVETAINITYKGKLGLHPEDDCLLLLHTKQGARRTITYANILEINVFRYTTPVIRVTQTT